MEGSGKWPPLPTCSTRDLMGCLCLDGAPVTRCAHAIKWRRPEHAHASTRQNRRNSNPFAGFYHCGFSGRDVVLQLRKALPSGKAGRGVHRISPSYFLQLHVSLQFSPNKFKNVLCLFPPPLRARPEVLSVFKPARRLATSRTQKRVRECGCLRCSQAELQKCETIPVNLSVCLELSEAKGGIFFKKKPALVRLFSNAA